MFLQDRKLLGRIKGLPPKTKKPPLARRRRYMGFRVEPGMTGGLQGTSYSSTCLCICLRSGSGSRSHDLRIMNKTFSLRFASDNQLVACPYENFRNTIVTHGLIFNENGGESRTIRRHCNNMIFLESHRKGNHNFRNRKK